MSASWRFLLAVLGTAGLASLVLVLLILARLTEKWEAVTRKRSRFHLFYGLAIIVALLAAVRLYHIGSLIPAEVTFVHDTRTFVREQTGLVHTSPELRSWLYLITYDLPLAVTMAISVYLTWRNWGWILKQGRTQRDQDGKRHRGSA